MTMRESPSEPAAVPPNLPLSLRTPSVIPNHPPVIPNGVRNLRAPFDGWLVSPTTLDVSRHLRFFVVRSSE